MVQGTPISSEIIRLIDEAIESMRWCRQHLEERAAVERLRRLQITLAGLSLALDYEMDGQHGKALQALDRADWQRQAISRFNPHIDPHLDPFPGWDDH